MKKIISAFVFVLAWTTIHSQTLVENIKISNGDNFFWESEHLQPAMLIKGKWQGKKNYWSPIAMGEAIMENAYVNDSLFSGDCIDLSIEGDLIGAYRFENGKLTYLKHFELGGFVCEYNYKNGIPNGVSTAYFPNGEIYTKQNYLEGVLDGPFLENYAFDNPDSSSGVTSCLEEGYYDQGKRIVLSTKCE
jgi:antitoxin component YwqK of YwqJK toxin-antitoxin module